jgi:small subunit ribosomal protein S6
MREYETTFIVQPELSDEGVGEMCARFEAVLANNGATKLFYDDMGKRRLAYTIKTFQKGQYLTIFYLDEGKASAELERAMRLDDSVLRYLTVLGNPNVADVEARKAEAVELERVRAEKAAERAQREAEDAARAVEEEAERQAALTAQAEANESAAAEAAAEAASGETDTGEAAAPEVAPDAPAAAAEPEAAEEVVKEEG